MYLLVNIQSTGSMPTNDKPPLHLPWTPLLRLADFPAAVASRSHYKHEPMHAVYVWGFQFENLFIPYYVGKTSKIYERAMQHYARFRGGEYAVYRCCTLRRLGELSDTQKQRVDPIGEWGPIYVPTSPYELGARFLSPSVQKELRPQLEAFRMAWAGVPTARDADEGEKTLAHVIDLKNLHCRVIGAGPVRELVHWDMEGRLAPPPWWPNLRAARCGNPPDEPRLHEPA